MFIRCHHCRNTSCAAKTECAIRLANVKTWETNRKKRLPIRGTGKPATPAMIQNLADAINWRRHV